MLNIWKYSTLKFSLFYGHFPTFLSQLSIFVEPLNFCSIREDIKNHNNPENYCRINIDKRRSAEMFLFRKRIYGKWCGGGGRGGAWESEILSGKSVKRCITTVLRIYLKIYIYISIFNRLWHTCKKQNKKKTLFRYENVNFFNLIYNIFRKVTFTSSDDTS